MDILEFISANTQLFSVAISAVVGFSAFVKWVDSRNRELEEKRYSDYMNLIGVISGTRKDGSPATMTEEIAATWFLIEYREYYHITERIFSNSDFKNMAPEKWLKNVLPHIENMLSEISVSSCEAKNHCALCSFKIKNLLSSKTRKDK